MTDSEKRMNTKNEELNGKLKVQQVTAVISVASMRQFCVGFHLPLMGSLFHLKDKTKSYHTIRCRASIVGGQAYTIEDRQEYDTFARAIEGIQAPTTIDFTFELTNSVYKVDGIPMNDIRVAFLVNFLQNNYEIIYHQNGQDELALSKNYYTDIEPEEILLLRDRICDQIFDRVSNNMEAVMAAM